MDPQMSDVSSSHGSVPPDTTETLCRKSVMAIVASASPEDLDRLLGAFGEVPSHEMIRSPETGLVMVRGRMGGTGSPFNLGEMTVTRCVVRLETGETGSSYIMGRHKRQALNAAIVDGLWQNDTLRQRVECEVIGPLQEQRRQHQDEIAAETAATRVDFFTMVRGDD